jgi:hypothetical protein
VLCARIRQKAWVFKVKAWNQVMMLHLRIKARKNNHTKVGQGRLTGFDYKVALSDVVWWIRMDVQYLAALEFSSALDEAA